MTIPAKPKAPTHSCPGGCGAQVRYGHFACLKCWNRLPFSLQQPIAANFRRDPAAHQAAMADAKDWYTNNPATAVTR